MRQTGGGARNGGILGSEDDISVSSTMMQTNFSNGTSFGHRVLDPDLERKVAQALKEDLPLNQISERRGPGGSRLKYLEHQVRKLTLQVGFVLA